MSDTPVFVTDGSDVTWDLGIGGKLTWTGVAGFGGPDAAGVSHRLLALPGGAGQGGGHGRARS